MNFKQPVSRSLCVSRHITITLYVLIFRNVYGPHYIREESKPEFHFRNVLLHFVGMAIILITRHLHKITLTKIFYDMGIYRIMYTRNIYAKLNYSFPYNRFFFFENTRNIIQILRSKKSNYYV